MNSFSELVENIRKMRELTPQEFPDVFVMTDEAFDIVMDNIKKDQSDKSDAVVLIENALAGIPVEHYPTLLEAKTRCIQLQSRGKSVGLVCK